MEPLLQGMLLGMGICLTLGPQSVFVLRQGIHGQAAIAVASICTVTDLLLIGAATFGVDALVRQIPGVASFSAWGGAVVAAVFGTAALSRAVWSCRAHAPLMPLAHDCFAEAIVAAIAISLLNPLTYLEMLMVVGGGSMRFHQDDRVAFSIGVALISPLWFFGLAAGGRRLANLFARPRAMVALDMTAGLTMLALAAAIVISELDG